MFELYMRQKVLPKKNGNTIMAQAILAPGTIAFKSYMSIQEDAK